MTKVIGNNGKTYNFPDSLSLTDIRAYLDKKIGKNNYEVQASDRGVVSNFIKGAKIGVVDTVLGAEQLVRDIVPGVSKREENLQKIIDKRKIDNEAILKTKSGTIGNIAGTIATAAPTLLIPGANTLTGSAIVGGALGAAQPVATGDSRTVNTALGAGGGFLGKIGGDKVAKIIKNKSSNKKLELDNLKNQRKQQDQLIKDAIDAGYVIPPSQVNPSVMNRVLEGSTGKINIQQGASIKNQTITNNIAKKSIGISEDTPLTKDAVELVQKNSGKVYEQVKDIGTINIDDAFRSSIDDALSDYRINKQNFKTFENPKIESLLDDLLGTEDKIITSFDSKALVALVKNLNKQSRTLGKSFDDPIKRETAEIYSKLSNEILELIERNLLIKKLPKSLIDDFRAARKNIAKTHVILNAMDESGNVVATKVKGKVLTDGLDLIKKFADLAPQSVQKQNKSFLGMSPLDAAVAVGTTAGTGSPLGLAALAARPIGRKALLSRGYQNFFVKPNMRYQTPKTMSVLENLNRTGGGLLGASVGANTQGGLLQ